MFLPSAPHQPEECPLFPKHCNNQLRTLLTLAGQGSVAKGHCAQAVNKVTCTSALGGEFRIHHEGADASKTPLLAEREGGNQHGTPAQKRKTRELRAMPLVKCPPGCTPQLWGTERAGHNVNIPQTLA